MKKGAFLFAVLVFAVGFLPFISGAYSLGSPNYSFETIYGPSQPLIGWINISFTNEPLTSSFLSIVGTQAKTVNLSDLLDDNLGYNHSCNPVDCSADLASSNPAAQKVIELNANEAKKVGLRFTGNVSTISSIKFDVQSNAGVSCVNQLKVDLFDNGTTDYQNTAGEGSQSCGTQNYGCFDSAAATEAYTLTLQNPQYCQKVSIGETPSVRIGAWIKNNSGTLVLKAGLHDSGGTERGSCTLPSVTGEGEYSCDVQYAVSQQGDYYVCIYPTSGTGSYNIRGNADPVTTCGFQGNDFGTSKTAAYQIFAQAKQFAAFGTKTVGNNLPDGNSFSSKAREYLANKYGEKNGKIDCTAGCTVPITFRAMVAQNVTVKNLVAAYQKDAGSVEEVMVYDVSSTPARITSGFKRLYLDGAGFNMPGSLGNHTFYLKVNSVDLLSQKVEVKDVPIITSVTPLRTATVFPTEFTAIVNSSQNITGFIWDFGDGVRTTTASNKATHTYNQTGLYTLTVNVTDQRKLSSVKSLTVNVTSPKDLIEARLDELEDSVKEIKTQIATLDSFSRDAITSAFSLDTVEAQLTSLNSRYSTATTEAQYGAIVTDILKLENIPESVSKTKGGENLPLISTANQVDLSALESIAGGSTGGNENYREAVAFWQVQNLDTRIDFTEYSGRYNGKLQPIVKVFTLSASEKADISYDYFLMFPEPEGFYSDSEFETEDGFVYINLREKNTVSFSTTEDVGFADLGAFVSPAVSRLSVEETATPVEGSNKWMFFWLVIVGLIIVGALVYMILHRWYRNHYEKHLFPNRNDLYNMSTYIHHALKKGMSNGDIEANLKKAGWSSEKIKYAMKKYAGKKIGMPF